MQRPVEQRRMHGEARSVGGLLLAERDLRERAIAVAPGGAHAGERRPVRAAAIREAVVEPLDVDRRGAGGRPLRGARRSGRPARADRGARGSGRPARADRGARGSGRPARADRGARGSGRPARADRGARGIGRRRRADRAGRVAGPLGAFDLRSGMDVDRAPAAVVGLADRHLERDVLAQRQRRRQDELVHCVAPDLRTRAQRDLDERRARQQDLVEQLVIGEPRLRRERQAAGQQPRVAAGERHRRTEQWVVHRLHARARQPGLRGSAGARRDPVAAALERVRRQPDPPAARQRRRPVDLDAADVRLAGRRQEARERPLAAPQ